MNKRPAYVYSSPYRYHCSKPFLWFGSPSLHSWWLQPWCHGHHPCPARTSEHVWTDGCHEPLRTRQMAQGPSRGRSVHPQGSNFCLLSLGLNPSVSLAASKLGIEHCRPKLPAAHRCCPAVHCNDLVKFGPNQYIYIYPPIQSSFPSKPRILLPHSTGPVGAFMNSAIRPGRPMPKAKRKDSKTDWVG